MNILMTVNYVYLRMKNGRKCLQILHPIDIKKNKLNKKKSKALKLN